MKKIYSGDVLPVVVLDTEQEIACVAQALAERIGRGTLSDPGTRVASELFAEISAPAPQ